MPKINQLTEDELKNLHTKVVSMREEVNQLVDNYGYTASQLVSRTFEHDLEAEFGRKSLKRMEKNEEQAN